MNTDPTILPVTFRPEVAETLRARMYSQFRGKPRIQALLAALGALLQDVEERRFNLVVSRTLELAQGVVLEQWGALVGEERAGLADEPYRQIIRVRMLANRSDSTVDALLAVWALILEPGRSSYGLNLLHPMSIVVWGAHDDRFDEVVRGRMRRLMEDIRPGGFSMTVIEAETGYFGLAGDPNGRPLGVGKLARLI